MDAAQMFKMILDDEMAPAKTYGARDIRASLDRIFRDTLTPQQMALYNKVDCAGGCVCLCEKDWYIMRGLQLAKAMREILDHPEKVLADVKEQEPTIEVQLQDEIAYLREYQKREQVAG